MVGGESEIICPSIHSAAIITAVGVLSEPEPVAAGTKCADLLVSLQECVLVVCLFVLDSKWKLENLEVAFAHTQRTLKRSHREAPSGNQIHNLLVL